jgi:hypothetical protein
LSDLLEDTTTTKDRPGIFQIDQLCLDLLRIFQDLLIVVFGKDKYYSMNTILNKLKEPSTYRGLTILTGLVGINFAPELTGAIGTAVAAIIGLIEVLRKEKK